MEIIETCLGHIGTNGLCDVCGQPAHSSGSDCNRITKREAPYFIHPLFGSGYVDGYKNVIEAYQQSLKELIEAEIDGLDFGGGNAASEWMEEAYKKVLTLIDKCEPNNQTKKA